MVRKRGLTRINLLFTDSKKNCCWWRCS